MTCLMQRGWRWGGGAEEKSGERAGGLRLDGGAPLQRDPLWEEGRVAKEIQPNEKSKTERRVSFGRKERETERNRNKEKDMRIEMKREHCG